MNEFRSPTNNIKKTGNTKSVRTSKVDTVKKKEI